MIPPGVIQLWSSTDLGSHVPSRIYGETPLGLHPLSIGSRVCHLVNRNAPNTAFGKIDCFGDSKQKVYQATRKTAYTPWQSYENQGLSVLQSIFPNAVFGALRFTRWQTRLPMDKGCKPSGVSPYIRDGTWEPKSVLDHN